MNTKGLLFSLAAGAMCFFFGYQFCKGMYAETQEAHDFRIELIDAQGTALELAEEVMNNNNLWDKDSTATMQKYIDYSLAVDSLYRTQI